MTKSTAYVVEGQWLTGNIFDHRFRYYRDAVWYFNKLKEHDAIGRVRMFKEVTERTEVKSVKTGNKGL